MVEEQSPSFRRPPLDEVVIGIQFEPPHLHNSTLNGEVWGLYKSEFPLVTEQPALPPQIEVFGGNPGPMLQFSFGPPPIASRLWFASVDESHLIQYQSDRFLLNWRNRQNGVPYPRHEVMLKLYRDLLLRLDGLYEKTFERRISVSQVEVTYINLLPMDDLSAVHEWLKFINGGSIDLEGINANFGQVLINDAGEPFARMYYELQSVATPNDLRQRAIRFSLTCRGRPETTGIDDALSSIRYYRDRIVRDFCRLTTDWAHEVWERER